MGTTAALTFATHREDALARDRGAVVWCGSLALLFACLWFISAGRDGSWLQSLPWDQSTYHTNSLRFARAIVEGGPGAFIHEWVHSSSTHTPLIPAVSGFLMAALGESRLVAESVLPLASFLLAFSVFRIVERLYSRRTAYAVSALTLCFPLSMTLSRTFLLEYPFAALFAAACWALVSSDGFRRLGPTLAFGALAGLASLARAGGPVLFVGPTLVALAYALRQRERVRRLAHLAIAAATGAAIAATWYLPNLSSFLSYLHSVTYGPNARLYAGTESGITLANFLEYARANVADGPGWPMVALAAAAYVVNVAVRRGSWRPSGASCALGAAYGIDFLILLSTYQKVGAVLFLPIIPVLAIAVVRAIERVERPAPREWLAIGIVLLALQHVVEMTFTFPVPQGRTFTSKLWNHRNHFLAIAEQVPNGRTGNFRVRETIERLEDAGIRENGVVVVIGDHPFFQVNALRYEALRRHHNWTITPRIDPVSTPAEKEARGKILRCQMNLADALILREGHGRDGSVLEDRETVEGLIDPDLRPFAQQGEPLELGDGSKAHVYAARSRVEPVDAPPSGLAATVAEFRGHGGEKLMLEASSLRYVSDDEAVITLCFRWTERPDVFPEIFVHLMRDGQMFRALSHRPIPMSETRVPDGPGLGVVRVQVAGGIPASNRERGFDVAVGLLEPKDRSGATLANGGRFGVWSSLPTGDNNTWVLVRSEPRLANAEWHVMPR